MDWNVSMFAIKQVTLLSRWYLHEKRFFIALPCQAELFAIPLRENIVMQ